MFLILKQYFLHWDQGDILNTIGMLGLKAMHMEMAEAVLRHSGI
jgi:hypothetical protein